MTKYHAIVDFFLYFKGILCTFCCLTSWKIEIKNTPKSVFLCCSNLIVIYAAGDHYPGCKQNIWINQSANWPRSPLTDQSKALLINCLHRLLKAAEKVRWQKKRHEDVCCPTDSKASAPLQTEHVHWEEIMHTVTATRGEHQTSKVITYVISPGSKITQKYIFPQF